MEFAGKTVLITGASSGLGAATALAFAEAGANLMIGGRDEARTAAIAKQAEAKGGKAAICIGDVREAEVRDRLIASTLKRFGRLDVLVNNAGLVYRTGAFDTTAEQWLDTMLVNVDSVFFLSRAAAQVMKDQGEGVIINIVSDLALVAAKGTPSYCTSKAAVLHMTKAMALDVAEYGIRVNAVAFGEIHTPMLESSIQHRGMPVADGLARLARRVPMKRVSTPKEVVGATLFLASTRRAGYATGTILSVDGGVGATGPGYR